MIPLLEVKHIVKRFKNIVAVNDVSFTIGKGTCFGLLGPNGAGKTTLIEIIEDIISATSGSVYYNGEPRSPGFREVVGIQFQQTALLAFLTIQETLETFQSLYQNSVDLTELMKECDLTEIQGQFNDKISGGQRQRLLLALALVNDPEILFLDEPSTGLDPHARRNLWRTIETQKALGKTIILTTHYMDEAQQLCDEVAIMDYGKIIAEGNPTQLISKYCPGSTISLSKTAFGQINHRVPFPFRETKNTIEIQAEDVNACLNTLLKNGIPIADMTIRSPNLENVFLNLTGHRLKN